MTLRNNATERRNRQMYNYSNKFIHFFLNERTSREKNKVRKDLKNTTNLI